MHHWGEMPPIRDALPVTSRLAESLQPSGRMKRSGTVSRRRMMTTLGLLGAATMGTGCWGSFNLTGKVYDWNGSFGSKWASWAVFLVFIILPVYGALLFVDAIVLNTIEFFSGNNPVQRSADLGNGQRVVFSPVEGDPDAVRVEHYDGDTVVRAFRIQKTRRGLKLHDAKGERLRVQSEAEQLAVRGQDGTTLATLDEDARDRLVAHVREGAAPTDAVVAALDPASMGRLLAVADNQDIGVRI